MLEKLNHIKQCNECGCFKIKEMSKKDRHLSGQWNEKLVFDCGKIFKYCPNFPNQIEESGQCQDSASYKTDKENYKAALAKLRTKIKNDKRLSDRLKKLIIENHLESKRWLF